MILQITGLVPGRQGSTSVPSPTDANGVTSGLILAAYANVTSVVHACMARPPCPRPRIEWSNGELDVVSGV